MEDIKKEFDFLFGLFMKADAELKLANAMYNDYDENDRSKEMGVIIIDSLYYSAAMNIYKIVQREECINLKKLTQEINEMFEDKNIKYEVDKKAILSIIRRRNKQLAHNDIENITKDISEEFPLYIDDLGKILKQVFGILNQISVVLCDGSIDGIDKSGEIFIKNTKAVISEYEIKKDYQKKLEKLFVYMKEHHKEELCSIIFSTEDTFNADSYNTHPEQGR